MGEEREEKEREESEASMVAEVLSVLHEHIPALVRDLLNVLISEDAGRRLGEAVGAFYKELKEAGMSPEDAVRMAREYMDSLVKLGRLLPGLGPMKLVRKVGKEEKEEEGAEESQEEEGR